MPSDKSPDLHIFDCDGVILNSNDLKLSALRLCLETVGASSCFIDWAVREFRMNFGRTRITHFDAFLRHAESNGYDLNRDKISSAMAHYSSSVVQLYEECQVIKETNQYIETLPSTCLIFVVSASDQSELRRILPNKCPRFEQNTIYGGPLSKTQNIRNVVDITNASVVFFYGDSIQDAKSAINSDVHFFGLTKYSADSKSLKEFCESHKLECYADCSEVEIR